MIVDCRSYSANTRRPLVDSWRAASWPERALSGTLVRAKRADWDGEVQWFDERGAVQGVSTDMEGTVVRIGDSVRVVGGSSAGVVGKITVMMEGGAEVIVAFPRASTRWALSGLVRAAK